MGLNVRPKVGCGQWWCVESVVVVQGVHRKLQRDEKTSTTHVTTSTSSRSDKEEGKREKSSPTEEEGSRMASLVVVVGVADVGASNKERKSEEIGEKYEEK